MRWLSFLSRFVIDNDTRMSHLLVAYKKGNGERNSFDIFLFFLLPHMTFLFFFIAAFFLSTLFLYNSVFFIGDRRNWQRHDAI